MRHPSSRAGTAGSSDQDLMVLILIAVVVLGGGGAALAADQAQRWLLEHGVLIDPADGPMLLLPGGVGGLDLPRLLIAAAVLLALVGLAAAAGRRRAEKELPR